MLVGHLSKAVGGVRGRTGTRSWQSRIKDVRTRGLELELELELDGA